MKKPITLVRAALVAAVCSLSVHADKVVLCGARRE